jgi:hypothetical protein
MGPYAEWLAREVEKIEAEIAKLRRILEDEAAPREEREYAEWMVPGLEEQIG